MTTARDAFCDAYVETALWADTPDGALGLSAAELAQSTFAKMQDDCLRFYDLHRDAIHCDGAPLSVADGPTWEREARKAGYDFWLTRNGHGAGFWDGDWPEPAASVLDAAAEAFGKAELYAGDDGLIYQLGAETFAPTT